MSSTGTTTHHWPTLIPRPLIDTSLVKATCSCGWEQLGYTGQTIAQDFWTAHVAVARKAEEETAEQLAQLLAISEGKNRAEEARRRHQYLGTSSMVGNVVTTVPHCSCGWEGAPTTFGAEAVAMYERHVVERIAVSDEEREWWRRHAMKVRYEFSKKDNRM